MSLLNRITALIPIGKQKEAQEYYFGLNIGHENLICALWTIEKNELKILQTSVAKYNSIDELIPLTDRLLDEVLGPRDLDPQKILFGVPSSWLSDENLKDDNIKVLRRLVKELELSPMAYVETSHALIHFLEKLEGIPPTAVLVGFENNHITVTVVRAGKLDGVKVVSRGDNSGADIEKALLSFTNVETLPSKILLYGSEADQLKNQLLSHSWMSKLSFLHFPKIDKLTDEIEIKSVCFAAGSEINPGIRYNDKEVIPAALVSKISVPTNKIDSQDEDAKIENGEDLGFMVGDVSAKENVKEEDMETEEGEGILDSEQMMDENYMEKQPGGLTQEYDANLVETDDFENTLEVEKRPDPAVAGMVLGNAASQISKRFHLKRFIPRGSKSKFMLGGVIAVVLLLLGAFLILPKAEVKIFVEPKILEKDTTVTADPDQKLVDEAKNVIPGQIVETDVSGAGKAQATGQKEVGNPAKGTVVIYNKTSEGKSLSKGTTLTSSNGLKFTLDTSVNIASQSATDSGITFGKSNAAVTASGVGADSNLASGSELSVGGFSSSQVSAKAEGNFSGGTSKTVTVVSSDDQSKLLASVASSLRKDAQQKLQEKLPQKKILEEALTEQIVNKSFNKNVGDQANEFSLNLTSKYKGTAFEDKDLKMIVSKLVITQVPSGFDLNLDDTETQADVSKVEKTGKLIFLAKFKAKLMPKIDAEKIKNQIKGKGVNEALNIIKGMENVLGADIRVSPSIPFLQIIPILTKNINVEIGLK